MKDLEKSIVKIGGQMVACKQRCAGISCHQKNGVLPRCLILESRPGSGGCAVVGINPGRAKRAEVAYYKKEGGTYDATVRYWQQQITLRPYYERLRKLTGSFGLNGPILWTELAKCENAHGTKFPPLQTLRACTGRFLTKELEAIPRKWPLIAIGKEAYRALAYLYPSRSVIGVPHPTGAYGDQFTRHLPGGSGHAKARKVVHRVLSESPGRLVWIGDALGVLKG